MSDPSLQVSSAMQIARAMIYDGSTQTYEQLTAQCAYSPLVSPRLPVIYPLQYAAGDSVLLAAERLQSPTWMRAVKVHSQKMGESHPNIRNLNCVYSDIMYYTLEHIRNLTMYIRILDTHLKNTLTGWLQAGTRILSHPKNLIVKNTTAS